MNLSSDVGDGSRCNPNCSVNAGIARAGRLRFFVNRARRGKDMLIRPVTK
jgi:hypothetical protein